MSASSKSKKKINSSKAIDRRIVYCFILLVGVNIILFSFLSYFLFRLYNEKVFSQTFKEISVPAVPVVDNSIKPVVSAASYIVYDPVSRSVIFSKNENVRISPASSIKILSALVALDYYDPEQYLTVKTLAAPDDSRMGLVWNEEIRVKDLLYGLLLPSGNDAAKTLAYYYPGGTEGFVAAMNKKAQELHLVDSKFFDPSGYEDKNYSTAFELARLASFALKNDIIREIVATRQKVVYNRYGTIIHPLENLNELLLNPRVTGVKTGFTNEAGGVLITSYVDKGRELIIVVMKSEDRFGDTRAILQLIDNAVSYSDVGVTDAEGVPDFTAGT